MCWAMYLFTENNIDEVKWDNKNPKLFIENMINKNEMDFEIIGLMKWNENNKNIYYIGSYEGCGCGWHSIGNDCNYDNDEEYKTLIENKSRDRKYLYELIKTNNINESYIIICWEGDQGNEIKETLKINIKEVKNINFEFEELCKYIFYE